MTKPLSKSPSRRRRLPPAFLPVSPRSRHDGWTVARQCAFLAQLYLTGSATAAAAHVNMTRMSAYRLRKRPDAISFAAAWDRILLPPGTPRPKVTKRDPRKVTNQELMQRAHAGLVQPVIHGGTMRAIRKKQDNSALVSLVARLDRIAEKYESDWDLD